MYQEEFKKYLSIKAFCIMPNHFHFLVHIIDPGVDNEKLPQFMMKLLASYSKYFNTKYSTPGSIWDGRYKAKYIDNDEYIYTIINYIQKNSEKHLNIPYTQWKYRSDIKLNVPYEEMFADMENYILES